MGTSNPKPSIITSESIRDALGERLGRGGHSQVFQVASPGGALVAKIFDKNRIIHAPDNARLDRIIELPPLLGPDDRDLISNNAAWPLARIVSDEAGPETIGVLLPAAPAKFMSASLRRRLTVDWLAQSDERQVRFGINPPTWLDRLLACRTLVAMGEMFERFGMVYGDWSYTNALWCRDDSAVFVIDIDSCSFGPQPNICALGWEDPLSDRVADAYTDRYRLALLVARCLTGRRSVSDVFTQLLAMKRIADGPFRLGALCLEILTTEDRRLRPALAGMKQAVEEAVVLAHAGGDFKVNDGLGGSLLPRSNGDQEPLPLTGNVIAWRKIDQSLGTDSSSLSSPELEVPK